MSNYKELKESLRKERKRLYNLLHDNQDNIDKYKKVLNIVNLMKVDKVTDAINIESFLRLKKYFPKLEDKFNELKQLYNYAELINGDKSNEFDFDGYLSLIKLFNKKYGIPPISVINDVEKTVEVINNIKSGNISKLDKDDLDTLLGKSNNKTHMSYAVIMATCQFFAFDLLKDLLKVLDDEKEEIDKLPSIEEINNKIELINKYSQKFSDDSLLEKFSKEELDEFIKIIASLLDKNTCEEILNNIKIDQETMDNVVEVVNFDTLDMSLFTEEEKTIIEQLRDIYEDEEVNSNNHPLSNVNISFNDRLREYNNLSMNEILEDVDVLLKNIYDNKDETVRIFKLIIDLYRKYNIKNIREERIIELQRISRDFNTIIDFINKTYKDKIEAFKDGLLVKKEVMAINNEYIPVINELIENEYYDDEDFDNELDRIISNYKNIIRKWKYKMTSFYQENNEDIDIRENTDNLVFCLNEDIDLEKEEYQKEFLGAIDSLENKSSKELKMRPGRKGMSRIRKTTESDKSKDFVEYLEARFKTHLHFVPYRYSSDINYRTGLIKFSTSPKVKEFLESRYGLSKQSAIYGIFQIISVIGADHSEYHIFEDYIMNNYSNIEDMGKMLSSDNPNYEELANVLDKLLTIKHELVNKINNNSKKI